MPTAKRVEIIANISSRLRLNSSPLISPMSVKSGKRRNQINKIMGIVVKMMLFVFITTSGYILKDEKILAFVTFFVKLRREQFRRRNI